MIKGNKQRWIKQLTMVSVSIFKDMALEMPEATMAMHFDKPSFRIRNKIFATLHEKDKKAVLKLSLVEQSVFVDMDPAIVYPVPGGWGKQGYTFVELSLVKKKILHEMIVCAWCNMAGSSLCKKYFPKH